MLPSWKELRSIRMNFPDISIVFETKKIIVEGAGGLLVPLTRRILTLELIRQSEIPLILVAPVSLGAINQTLLSIEAVQNRKVNLKGIYFIGVPDKTTEDNIRTITEWSGATFLGNFFLNSKEKMSRERFQIECLSRFDQCEAVKRMFV